MWVFRIAVAMFTMSVAAYAQYPTMNDLSKACKVVYDIGERKFAPQVASEKSFDWGFCTGYISAAFQAGITGDTLHGTLFCTDSGASITLEQLAKVFLKYSEEHPAKLHENAFQHVALSFMEAFPCRRKP